METNLQAPIVDVEAEIGGGVDVYVDGGNQGYVYSSEKSPLTYICLVIWSVLLSLTFFGIFIWSIIGWIAIGVSGYSYAAPYAIGIWGVLPAVLFIAFLTVSICACKHAKRRGSGAVIVQQEVVYGGNPGYQANAGYNVNYEVGGGANLDGGVDVEVELSAPVQIGADVEIEVDPVVEVDIAPEIEVQVEAPDIEIEVGADVQVEVQAE